MVRCEAGGAARIWIIQGLAGPGEDSSLKVVGSPRRVLSSVVT